MLHVRCGRVHRLRMYQLGNASLCCSGRLRRAMVLPACLATKAEQSLVTLPCLRCMSAVPSLSGTHLRVPACAVLEMVRCKILQVCCTYSLGSGPSIQVHAYQASSEVLRLKASLTACYLCRHGSGLGQLCSRRQV